MIMEQYMDKFKVPFCHLGELSRWTGESRASRFRTSSRAVRSARRRHPDERVFGSYL